MSSIPPSLSPASIKPYCCPRCKAPLGYTEDHVLHIEINGRTYLLDGFIRLTCPAPCNHQWKYRSANARKPGLQSSVQGIA